SSWLLATAAGGTLLAALLVVAVLRPWDREPKPDETPEDGKKGPDTPITKTEPIVEKKDPIKSPPDTVWPPTRRDGALLAGQERPDPRRPRLSAADLLGPRPRNCQAAAAAVVASGRQSDTRRTGGCACRRTPGVGWPGRILPHQRRGFPRPVLHVLRGRRAPG